jgi:hypothetical protein
MKLADEIGLEGDSGWVTRLGIRVFTVELRRSEHRYDPTETPTRILGATLVTGEQTLVWGEQIS